MTVRAPVEVAPGTDVRGFVPVGTLGAGGFGTVYRGQRQGQPYALKFLRHREVGHWAGRELASLMKVAHPSVVKLEGFGYWPEQTREFVVVFMEYVEGRRLDEWAQEENPCALQVGRALLSLGQALAALHREGVVHRDVKEANILVRARDGQPVLVDFGAAGGEGLGTRVTRGRLPPGTPCYRSPEAWRWLREHAGVPGARYEAGPGDDLYALGVVLYWLLTGALPAEGESEAEQALLTLERVAPAPHEVNARVPEKLSALCMRLLAKQPQERFGASAEAFCQAMEEALSGAGEEWSQPLCEPHAVDNVTTGEDPEKAAHDGGLDRWVRQGRHDAGRPRRGKRPAAEPAPPAASPPGPEPAAAPLEHAPPLAPPLTAAPLVAQPPPSLPVSPVAVLAEPAVVSPGPGGAPLGEPSRASGPLKRLLAVVSGLVLAGMVGWMVALPEPRQEAPATRPEQPVAWEPGEDWKVAPPWRPPDTPSGARAGEAVGLSAQVAPAATENEGAAVKNPKQKKQAGAVTKAAVTGCLAGMVGCSAPATQVRPQPPPEACPKGALESMAKLGITPGSISDDATLIPLDSDISARIISVKEGWTSMGLWIGFKKLRAGTLLSGRLIFGDRVYGRFTQATLPKEDGGGTVPVCFELLDGRDDRGLEYRPGSTESEAKVGSSTGVKAVERFE
jgi:predicted Ser/Thr protein kinase